MSPTPLLEIDRLSVRFGAATVVNDVSFTIQAGEKFALVGESGSGKSITALSVLPPLKVTVKAAWPVLAPVLATQTHANISPLGWSEFETLVSHAKIPVYALGGLSKSDLPYARQLGAQGIAAIRKTLQRLGQLCASIANLAPKYRSACSTGFVPSSFAPICPSPCKTRRARRAA